MRKVMLLVEVLALGSIKDIDTLLIELLYLSAHDLHCTVHHTVLLGECLGKDCEATWQPALREHAGMLTTLLEHVHVGLNLPNFRKTEIIVFRLSITMESQCTIIMFYRTRTDYAVE